MVLRVEVSGTQRITYTQEYNPENRLAVVTNTVTGQVTRFVYDGDGNRVLRIGPEGTTVYIGDYYEQTGSTVRKYYYAAGQRMAVRVGGALYFLHGDHLGSATLTTDGGGNWVGEARYAPYGEMRRDYPRGVIPTDRLYTGQRQETFGLYDYRARYYHPALGRFISADPLVPEPGNPQALNRYAYVTNNPLRYTDPSGHFAWFVAVPVGALIGAGVTYGFQVAANISQNGLNVQAFTEVNWAAVGGGAVAGAVGVATFGVGTAVMGTGLGATVAAGAISGAVSGQAARATENVLSGQELTAGLGNPADIATEAVVGGALAGVGYGIGRLARPAVARAARDAAAQEAQSLVDDIVRTELKNVRLSQYPQYNPDIPLNIYGRARQNTFTQIGPRAIQEGRGETLITIVHEEMHHRLWARGWQLPRVVEENYVERVAQRFARLKGW